MGSTTTLRWWRKRRGWTQAELARRAHVTQAMVSGIERGQTLPRLSTLQKIARALDTRPRNLLRR